MAIDLGKFRDFFQTLPWPTQLVVVIGMVGMGITAMFIDQPAIAIIVAVAFSPVPLSMVLQFIAIVAKLPLKELAGMDQLDQIKLILETLNVDYDDECTEGTVDTPLTEVNQSLSS